jgi:Ca2+-binding EF-hand superfamily protein
VPGGSVRARARARACTRLPPLLLRSATLPDARTLHSRATPPPPPSPTAAPAAEKGHGYLTEEDFSAALATLGVSVEESSGLFKDVSLGDADGIHWNSFIAAVMPRSILTQERLQEAFDALDVQRLGYLTEDSFKDVMAGDAEALDEGDSIASLFRGSERVDFAAFSEAFYRENSPEGAAAGAAGSSVSNLVLPPAACPTGRQRTASSMFLLGSLASPAREATSSSRRLASIFVSPAGGGGGESFPLGLPSSVGATRTPAVSGVAAQSRAEGFAPSGILSPVVPAPPT